MTKFSFLFLLASFSIYGQHLIFQPKKNHTYHYKSETFAYKMNSLGFLSFNIDYDVTFLKDDRLSVKVNHYGGKLPNLVFDSRDVSGSDSILVSKLTAEPYIFKPTQNGFRLENSKKLNKRQETFFNRAIQNDYFDDTSNSNKVYLKEGYSWERTDSIKIDYDTDEKQAISYLLSVDKITRKEIIISGTGSIPFEGEEADVAIKYVLDKNTGMPLYIKQIIIPSTELSGAILMITKIPEYEAPSLFEEAVKIRPLLDNKGALEIMDSEPMKYQFRRFPLEKNKKEVKRMLNEYMSSQRLYFDADNSLIFSSDLDFELLEKKFEALLTGSHLEINTINFYDKNGEKLNHDMSNDKFKMFKAFGTVYCEPFVKLGKIERTEAIISFFKATKREIVSTTSNLKNSKYELTFAKDTVKVSVKEFTSVDALSFKFFNEDGKELDSVMVQVAYLTLDEYIGNKAIANAFIMGQIENKNELELNLNFLAKGVSKVTFDELLNYKEYQYKKTVDERDW
ncbi:hypothetical protein [Galbibacter mesophilus]|uniref:hypothetical protein n=1 Tax=Galbibacter mesophilus TaxID=379069 RepID=UPI00191FAB98|nr:hypothetical protein [Galbibacter mesophilus]MCM5662362.1 hypothetical protein [Galbibacter mesophilus]